MALSQQHVILWLYWFDISKLLWGEWCSGCTLSEALSLVSSWGNPGFRSQQCSLLGKARSAEAVNPLQEDTALTLHWSEASSWILGSEGASPSVSGMLRSIFTAFPFWCISCACGFMAGRGEVFWEDSQTKTGILLCSTHGMPEFWICLKKGRIWNFYRMRENGLL